MSIEEKVEKIEKVESRSPASQVEIPVERVAPDGERFGALIDRPEKSYEVSGRRLESQKSLLEEVRDLNTHMGRMERTSPDLIVAQAQELIARIDGVKSTLSTNKDLVIKPSVEKLMRARLSHIDEGLKIAFERAGVEYVPLERRKAKDFSGPIDSFLGALTNAQFQLDNLAYDVKAIHDNRDKLSPAHMLAIQIKVGFIQGEVEFFTSLLNKALESTKTVMNVQV